MAQKPAKGATRPQRRDQRRPVSRKGWINGIEVNLIDLSFTGVGVGTLTFDDVDKLDLQDDEDATIEFPGPDGTKLALPIRIRRADHSARKIGATFSKLSEADYDAIEKLMFPRKIKSGK